MHAPQFLYQATGVEYEFKAEEKLDADSDLAERVYRRLARRLIQGGTGALASAKSSTGCDTVAGAWHFPDVCRTCVLWVFAVRLELGLGKFDVSTLFYLPHILDVHRSPPLAQTFIASHHSTSNPSVPIFLSPTQHRPLVPLKTNITSALTAGLRLPQCRWSRCSHLLLSPGHPPSPTRSPSLPKRDCSGEIISY